MAKMYMIVWRVKFTEAAKNAARSYWSEKATIENKGKLIKEQLCEPIPVEDLEGFPEGAFSFMGSHHGNFYLFVNFTEWDDNEGFKDQIMSHYTGKMLDFEALPRQRYAFDVLEVRDGGSPLPEATCE